MNQSNIRSTEKTDSDIQKLKDFINSGNEIHSIEIKSFASPEGTVNANDDVSDRRLKCATKNDKTSETNDIKLSLIHI